MHGARRRTERAPCRLLRLPTDLPPAEVPFGRVLNCAYSVPLFVQ